VFSKEKKAKRRRETPRLQKPQCYGFKNTACYRAIGLFEDVF
jgi:hypothetical protein